MGHTVFRKRRRAVVIAQALERCWVASKPHCDSEQHRNPPGHPRRSVISDSEFAWQMTYRDDVLICAGV